MIGDLLFALRQQLEPLSETPSLDAQILLAYILEKPRAWVLAHPEALLTAEQEASLQRALTRLLAGEPLPYVIGEWEFFGLVFNLTPAVLIPRPETELLVEGAIEWLNSQPHVRQTAAYSLCIADVGTGSGCIAIALTHHLPDIRVAAIDISWAALQVAHLNARRHRVSERLSFLQADLLSCFTSRPTFHLICANLPYIPSNTLPYLPVSKSEPVLALDGGPGGMEKIERFLRQAQTRLAPGGRLLIEIEASLGQLVPALAQHIFPSAAVQLWRDYSEQDRLVSVQLPE